MSRLPDFKAEAARAQMALGEEGAHLLLEAGRAQIRDVLFAQESLLSTQNALTDALRNYRVTELELQRDMDVLEITEDGLWREYTPNGNE